MFYHHEIQMFKDDCLSAYWLNFFAWLFLLKLILTTQVDKCHFYNIWINEKFECFIITKFKCLKMTDKRNIQKKQLILYDLLQTVIKRTLRPPNGSQNSWYTWYPSKSLQKPKFMLSTSTISINFLAELFCSIFSFETYFYNSS